MITFTDDKAEAYRFGSWDAATEWARNNQGSKGHLPISWRVNEVTGKAIVEIPGLRSKYVMSIDVPEADNSWEPLGPEYGQTLGGSADIETVGDLIDLLSTCDRSEVIRVQVRGTGSLRSVRNLNDTATTTGHPIVILRTH